jgi:hypothetical protein
VPIRPLHLAVVRVFGWLQLFGLLMPVLRRTILVPEKMFGPVHRFWINWDETVSAG